MKIKPIESIAMPNYPDKYSDESRQAAINAIPLRWKTAPLALSLSAAVAIGLTGCAEKEDPEKKNHTPTATITTTATPKVTTAATTPKVADATVTSAPETSTTPKTAKVTDVTVTSATPKTTATTATTTPNTSGTTSTSRPTTTTTPRVTTTTTPRTTAEPRDVAPPEDGTFIPLFEFGSGTGSIGCVAIAAPAFFSEEEAYAILASALKEHGLELAKNAGTLKNINLPVTYEIGYSWDPYTVIQTPPTTKTGDLQVHAVNEISVKFVSSADARNWEVPFTGTRMTGSFVNVKEPAQILAESNPMLAVFYDPISYVNFNHNAEDWSTERERVRKAAIEQSGELLRQQVGAFIEWLQQEGLLS